MCVCSGGFNVSPIWQFVLDFLGGSKRLRIVSSGKLLSVMKIKVIRILMLYSKYIKI
jgi:hypothetical protein